MLLVVLIMKMGYSAVQNYNEGKLGSAVKWIFMACMTYAIL